MATTTDVEKEILGRAGLTVELVRDLPMVSRVFDGAKRDWEAGKQNPGNQQMIVHSMFLTPDEDEEGVPGDVRVYSFPQTEGVPFARYVINRIHPGFTTESMSDESFMDEVASEMRELALAKGAIEECPGEDCDAVNPTGAEVCGECGTRLLEEEEPEVMPAAGNSGQPVAPRTM
jgi:hypothetical protein